MKFISIVRQIIGKKAVLILAGKTASLSLFILSLVIAYQLFEHGQVSLGAYMLVESLTKKLKLHDGHGSEAMEHAVHESVHHDHGGHRSLHE